MLMCVHVLWTFRDVNLSLLLFALRTKWTKNMTAVKGHGYKQTGIIYHAIKALLF